jgi:CHAD domain-containing protein
MEVLHQLRVALRRLDTALGAFGREFGQDGLEALRDRAKMLMGRLAPARDLDVFTEKLLSGPPKSGVPKGLPQLKARAEHARDGAWAGVGLCLSSADFEGFVDDVAALASSRLPLSRDKRLPRAASRMLQHQMKRVKKRGKAASSAEEADLHRLRIALKKLRYTCEFFAPLYSARKVARYLKRLRELQNHLGDLNDAVNVRHVVAALLQDQARKDDGVMCYGAGAMVGWYGAQVPAISKAALKRYRKFKKVQPFWS